MRLTVLQSENRIVPSIARTEAPLSLPAFEFGDNLPIELQCYQRSIQNPSLFTLINLSEYDVTLNIGYPNVRALLGFWTITNANGTTEAIPSRADKYTVRDKLKNIFGNLDVEGGQGSYIVTLENPGVWATPTADFQGATLSEVLVFELSPGTATTPAQYRIEVLEVAPARIPSVDWSNGDTAIVNSLTGSGALWELILDQRIDVGFYTLTVNSFQTARLSSNDGPFEIQNALAMTGHSCRVQRSATGSFMICFDASVSTFTISNGNLRISPFIKGNLDMSSTGIREMLDGVEWCAAELQIKIAQNANIITVASAPIIVKMPINQPATINIDTPSNSGLIFTISPDESYLEIIQAGNVIAEVPLLPPQP